MQKYALVAYRHADIKGFQDTTGFVRVPGSALTFDEDQNAWISGENLWDCMAAQ
jgi:hypothetical protein